MCTETGVLDTINTVQKHRLTSTCLEKMQLMVHVSMTLQMAELATPDVSVSLLCCVAKELSTFIDANCNFYG